MPDQSSSADESMRIAHLTMLQGVIGRMASNSFTLKTLAISFAGAWIAFMAATSKSSIFFWLAASIPVLMFWILDAQYLRMERAYRRLYEHVRAGEGIDAYSMDFSPFAKDVGSVVKVMLSWSVAFYYIVILVSCAVLGFVLMNGEPHA